MSRILFLNGNAHGHINPTLPVVTELTKRGEEVIYFSTKEFKLKIEATGAKFMDYGSKLYDFFKDYKPVGSHPFYSLVDVLLGMDRVVVQLVLDSIYDVKIDRIIHDSMFGAGNILARKLNLPAICSCTSFAMNKLPLPIHMLEPGFHPQLDLIYKELKEAQAEWNIGELDIMDIFFKKEKVNLVYTSRMFQPDADSFDETFRFVGPSIAVRNEKHDFPLAELNDSTVVYISMGTINNQCMDFYTKCIEAFADRQYKVVMSVGIKVDIAALGKIPNNIILRNHVPQLEVLKRTAVFISHGGLNSVSEALYYGVPVIAVPQANDQPMVASQLVKLGAGLCLKMSEVTPEILKNSVIELLENNSYKNSSIELGKSLVQAGGYKTAADIILQS